MDNNMLFLSAKIVVFAFIVTSPFYNVSKVFSFLDNIPAKMIFLIAIVAASFVDLQLAIVLAIAFFILIISFNSATIKTANNKLVEVKPLEKKLPYEVLDKSIEDIVPLEEQITSGVVPRVTPSSTPRLANASDYQYININKEDKPQQQQGNDQVMQTMYDFPDAKCASPGEYNTELINQSIVEFNLDNKIKPYEEFIGQLTSNELIENASNGAFLQHD